MNEIGILFQMSSWQSGLAFAILLLGVISLGILGKKKGRSVATFVALIAGLIFGGILYSFQFTGGIGNAPSTSQLTIWESEVNSWLGVMPGIFIAGISLFIPFLIFLVVIRFFIRPTKLKHRTLIGSYLLVFLIVAITLVVVVAMYPLWKQLRFNTPSDTVVLINNIPSAFSSWAPSTFSMFTSLTSIISVVIIGIIVGSILISIRHTHIEYFQKIDKFLISFQSFFQQLMKFFISLLPYAIFSIVPQIFYNGVLANTMWSIGMYFGYVLSGMIGLTLITYILGRTFSKTFSSYKQIFRKQELVSDKQLKKIKFGVDNSELTLPNFSTNLSIIFTIFLSSSILIVTALSTPTFVINNAFWLVLVITSIAIAFGTLREKESELMSAIAITGGLGFSYSVTLMIISFQPIYRYLSNISMKLTNSTIYLLLSKYTRKINKKVEVGDTNG